MATSCGKAADPAGRDAYVEDRHAMVKFQIEARGVRDPLVLDAMRSVPRHLFVQPGLMHRAYDDHPLPIGMDQTISQPYIVAAMTELARVKPGDSVFEVGTGSGYQAAVLDAIGAKVFTIEIVEPLATSAAERLKALGYTNTTVKAGDGYIGWPEHAPFDAILVTCGADHVPQPLVDQLKPGARMVIPVGESGEAQWLQLLTKNEDGTMLTNNVMPVRFVPLTGERAKTR